VWERVGRCKGQKSIRSVRVVKGFVGDDENLELDSLLYWEPVDLLKDWGDVISGAGVGE